jgi:hypothetical protein
MKKKTRSTSAAGTRTVSRKSVAGVKAEPTPKSGAKTSGRKANVKKVLLEKKKNSRGTVKTGTVARKAKAEKVMSGMKKKYVKSSEECKVTFRLPKAAAQGAGRVMLVGDFNDWDMTGIEMKRLKSGDFTVTLDLCGNKEYRFKYCIDSIRWENDWCADKYIPNPFGSEDSVVIL